MGKFLFGFGFAISVFLGWAYYNYFGDLKAPKLPDFYWGPKSREGKKEDATIRPFKIEIDDKVLEDLKLRLKLETSSDGYRPIPALEGIGFEYGFNSNFLKKLTNHWLNKYEWRTREKLMNKYSHFKTNINGIELHFQHIKYTGNKKFKQTRPLLLLHGWPGSFIEFQKSIPALLEPKNSEINFELVIPSLPGFGFSERSHRPGLGYPEMTQTFVKLMKRLGHEKFYVQGGDWGSIIATTMGGIYPKNAIAIHSNMCASLHPRTFLRLIFASIYPELVMDKEDIPKLFPVSSMICDLMLETGYMHLQATKPDTLGSALSQTPTGLAAYILEKFSAWTNKNWIGKEDGGLSEFNMDELLDNVMIYWVTNSITSSVRLYSESFIKRQLKYYQLPVKVPTGCLMPPGDPYVSHTPYFLQDQYYNILSFKKISKGGHFTAFEVPETFTKEVVEYFNLVESSGTVDFGK